MLYEIFKSGMSFPFVLAYILGYAFVVLCSLSMHEFAHAVAAYRAGDITAKSMGRLSVNPFKHIDPLGMLAFLFVGFGWAKPVPINPLKFRNYKKDMVTVSLAGVLMNLALGVVCSLFASITGFYANTNAFVLFLNFVFNLGTVVNFGLAVFNFLPIYPLDGFNCISTFLKYDNKFVVFMQKYGSILMFVLIISGLFGYVFSAVTGGMVRGLDWIWKAIFF